jgi:hypothetical protein
VCARLSSQSVKHIKLLFGATGLQSGGLTVVSSFTLFANSVYVLISKGCLFAKTAQAIRAILLARATTATLKGFRFLSSTSHEPKYLSTDLSRHNIDLAAWINRVRSSLFPRLDIPNNVVFPPVEY